MVSYAYGHILKALPAWTDAGAACENQFAQTVGDFLEKKWRGWKVPGSFSATLALLATALTPASARYYYG